MTDIEFEFRLTSNEFTSGVMRMNMRKPVFIILMVVGLFMLLSYLLSLIRGEGEIDHFSLLVGLIFTVLIPLSTIRSIKRNYKRLPKLKELMKYVVTERQLCIEAETYNCTLQLDQIHKVMETKKMLLIYENKLQAYLIPKRALVADQLNEIKNRIQKAKRGL